MQIPIIDLLLYFGRGSSGRKQVFSKKTGNGSLLCMSVEELAISHYKSQGFSYGKNLFYTQYFYFYFIIIESYYYL